MKRAAVVSIGMAVLITSVYACGGSKSPTPTGSTPTTTSVATTSVATTTVASTTTTTTTTSSSISGTVTDAVSGAPVSAVAVAVQNQTATTGADGRYSITGLTAATSAVTARHQGHRNFSQNTAINGATTVNIVLTPAAEANGAGNWTGTWRNNTFNSSGNVTLQMTVDTVNERFSGSFDMSGSVFGRGDPAAETISGSYSTSSGATLSGSSTFYGTVSGSISTSGAITGSLTNPTPTIPRVDFSGTATTSAIDITFTVRFSDGSTATGTVNLRK